MPTPMHDILDMEALALRALVVKGDVRGAVLRILLRFHHLPMRRCVERRHTVLNEKGVAEMRPCEGCGDGVAWLRGVRGDCRPHEHNAPKDGQKDRRHGAAGSPRAVRAGLQLVHRGV